MALAKYLKSFTISRSCPLCVGSGGTEGVFHIIALVFLSSTVSPIWLQLPFPGVGSSCAYEVLFNNKAMSSAK